MLLLPPPCKSNCRKAADAGKKNPTIESSQKTGSVLFDGVDPNLPVKDFTPDSSNPAVLTGGLLLDLKAAEPDLSKVSPLTDFSLDKRPALEFAKTALLPQKAKAASNPAGFICSTASIRCADLNLLETITIPRAEEALAKTKEALVIAEEACDRDPKYCVFLPTFEQSVADAREVLQCGLVQRTAAKEKCGSTSWFTGSWFEDRWKDVKAIGNRVKEKIGDMGDWSKEKINNYLADIQTVGDWILEKELDAFTSYVTEFWTPTANMLLKHARDGKGEPLSNDDQAYLREKIQNTSEYQDTLKKVLAQLEKDPTLKYAEVGGEYGLFNTDLFFGIHRFDVTGEKMPDGTILIIFKGKYYFTDGDNPYGIGAWWQNAGLIKPYEINITMPVKK
ncbi:MAG: hypothetical protein HY796_06625 [Elusimicrobia bacterium]|nr:hypothetical protein [Elusimicrobiota bacterium]